ncbi:MAG: nucleoside deaminase [Oscillospiraceae bacterium]|nr:nucleoside deaminase [Oscillospiraceae bacterium]
MSKHRDYMAEALKLAKKAADVGEVPVGAVVAHNGEIVGRGYNTRETEQDALGHREINAIRQACQTLGRWRLDDCVLYVNLEPCIMCAGAIINSRIPLVVYSCIDFKAGAMGGRADAAAIMLTKPVETIVGVCEEESLALLDEFFKNLRNKK